jgi:hypothetical protein
MNRVAVVMALLVVAGVTGLWVARCSGPWPVVDGPPLVRAPQQPGQPYQVEATIRNTGPGHGEVQVTFSLRDRASGKTYQHIDRAQLEAGEVAHLAVEIPAPPGDYESTVHVDYPPG